MFLADVGLHVWHVVEAHRMRVLSDEFAITNVHTNDGDGILIVDKKTGQPLWGKWDFGFGGKPDAVSFFFEGRNLMNVHLRSDERPRIDVTFFGPDGKVRAIWADRGGDGGFTERTQYGRGEPRKQVWFDEAWYNVQYRTNGGRSQAGILVGEQWHHLKFTNGTWTTVP
jgi:hypothetical protein